MRADIGGARGVGQARWRRSHARESRHPVTESAYKIARCLLGSRFRGDDSQRLFGCDPICRVQAARSHQLARQRSSVFAALEDRDAAAERGLVALDSLDEAPPVGWHIVNQLWLVQAEPVEIDQVDVGAQSRRKPAAIVQAKEVGGFAGLPLDQHLQRQIGPR